MEALCTINFTLDSQYLNRCCINDQWQYPNQNQDVKPQSETSRKPQNLEYLCFKDQWPYPNQDQDTKLRSGTSSILQSPKSGLKGQDVLFPFKIKTSPAQLRLAQISSECIIILIRTGTSSAWLISTQRSSVLKFDSDLFCLEKLISLDWLREAQLLNLIITQTCFTQKRFDPNFGFLSWI